VEAESQYWEVENPAEAGVIKELSWNVQCAGWLVCGV